MQDYQRLNRFQSQGDLRRNSCVAPTQFITFRLTLEPVQGLTIPFGGPRQERNISMTGQRLAHTAITLAALLASSALAQQHDMPAGMTCQQHQAHMKKEAEMKKHGNIAMGFDQDKTT